MKKKKLEVATAATDLPILQVPLDTIGRSPTNPRKLFPAQALEELASTIRRHGVLQPIIVRLWPAHYSYEGEQPTFEIVAGERRWRASRLAERSTIPCIVHTLSDAEVMEIQLIENLRRDDIDELEEAEGYRLLMETHSYTGEMLAEKVGTNKAHIYARLKLCALSEYARDVFRSGKLSASTALLIARMPTIGLQDLAAHEVATGNGSGEPMSVRAALAHIQNRYTLQMDRAPWPLHDVSLVADAGSCEACPKRTSINRELFHDISADVCTDPDCFGAKAVAFSGSQASNENTGNDMEEAQENASLSNDDTSEAPDQIFSDERPDADHASNTVAALAANEDAATVDEKQVEQNERALQLEIERERELVLRKTLHFSIRAALDDRLSRGEPADTADIAMIAKSFWLQISEYGAPTALLDLWCAPQIEVQSASGETVTEQRWAELDERINLMSANELFIFLMDIALTELRSTHFYGPEITTPDELVAAAERHGISVAALREELNPRPQTAQHSIKTKKSKKVTQEKKAKALSMATPAEEDELQTDGHAIRCDRTIDMLSIESNSLDGESQSDPTLPS